MLGAKGVGDPGKRKGEFLGAASEGTVEPIPRTSPQKTR